MNSKINDVLDVDKSISNKKKDKKEKDLKMKDIFEIKNAKYKRIVMKKEKSANGKSQKLVKNTKPIDIKGVKKTINKDVPKYAEENHENMIVNRAIKVNAKKKTLI
jgi:hypothetical protein